MLTFFFVHIIIFYNKNFNKFQYKHLPRKINLLVRVETFKEKCLYILWKKLRFYFVYEEPKKIAIKEEDVASSSLGLAFTINLIPNMSFSSLAPFTA